MTFSSGIYVILILLFFNNAFGIRSIKTPHDGLESFPAFSNQPTSNQYVSRLDSHKERYFELADLIAQVWEKQQQENPALLKQNHHADPWRQMWHTKPVNSDVVKLTKVVETALQKDHGINFRQLIDFDIPSFEDLKENRFTLTCLAHSADDGLTPLQIEGTFIKSNETITVTSINNTHRPTTQSSPSSYDFRSFESFSKRDLPENETGAGQIEKLLNLFKYVECDYDALGLCKRGTVKIDHWLKETLKFQRSLGRDLTLDKYAFLATHNSFNNRADGYGEYNADLLINKILRLILGDKFTYIYAQQQYTMTDQLNMGIRGLHLDPHWFFDDIRLCHSGMSIKVIDDIVHEFEKIFHVHVNWDSQNLFCSPYDRPWRDGLKEINDWLELPENSQEFIFVHDDDQHEWTWNKTDLVLGPLVSIFGDKLFTPKDKAEWYPDRWPTIRELLSRGKHIIFQNENPYGAYKGDIVFPPFLIPRWDSNCVKHFSPYPDCGGYPYGSLANFGSESQILGPFYDGSEACGLFLPETLPMFLPCGISYLGMDEVSPALIQLGAIWSWELGQPLQKEEVGFDRCAVLRADTGRWNVEDCKSQNLSVICRNIYNHMDWRLSDIKGPWDGGKDICGLGFDFVLPENAFQNQRIVDMLVASNVDRVWLNFNLELDDLMKLTPTPAGTQ